MLFNGSYVQVSSPRLAGTSASYPDGGGPVSAGLGSIPPLSASGALRAPDQLPAPLPRLPGYDGGMDDNRTPKKAWVFVIVVLLLCVAGSAAILYAFIPWDLNFPR